MTQHQAELVTLAPDLAHCPRNPIPEIAFSGRSNVGKSSLLNLMVGRKQLAYVSNTPGRTRTLTYFLVDQRWHLVDMPGYGYARVPPDERRRWLAAMRNYLRDRQQLVGVVQLIDMRVGFTSDDDARVRDLLRRGLPLCIAMTKVDKVPRSRQEALVRQYLADVDLPPETAVVLTSAVHGYGRKELWSWVQQVLAEHAAHNTPIDVPLEAVDSDDDDDDPIVRTDDFEAATAADDDDDDDAAAAARRTPRRGHPPKQPPSQDAKARPGRPPRNAPAATGGGRPGRPALPARPAGPAGSKGRPEGPGGHPFGPRGRPGGRGGPGGPGGRPSGSGGRPAGPGGHPAGQAGRRPPGRTRRGPPRGGSR